MGTTTYNFTKFHQNWMKNKEVLSIARFSVHTFKSVSRIVKIAHSDALGNEKIFVLAEDLNLLLAFGTDVDATDENGCTALHRAVECGANEAMEILVQNKCHVDARDTDLMTPLMYAALNGQPRVMRNLLEKNVHVDAKDKDGWNALHWAAKMADRETCKLLVGT